MKVIIASTVVPFVEGGATLLVDWLGEALRRRGHTVEILKFPFSARHEEILEQMLAFRWMDLSQHGDRLIAIRPPSYLLRHPHKVVWFIHHYRAAYDLWGTRYQDLPAAPEGVRCREAIMQADRVALQEARKIYSNSQVVAERLQKFNGVAAEVLYPPVFEPQRYRTGEYGDYLLYVSRLTHHKRQWLAVEALRHTRTPVRLVMVGPPDPGAEPYAEELRSLVQRHGLSERVALVDAWIPEEDKIKLFAGCLAAVYIPLDEDSYGYPSLEAHHAGKAVLSTVDSGGTRELIVDGVNGFLTASDPEALAAAMDQLYLDRALARRMGEAGRRRVAELGITWERVVDRLLE